MEVRPLLVVISIGLTVTTLLVLSTWYTSVAEPEVVLTSTVAARLPQLPTGKTIAGRALGS